MQEPPVHFIGETTIRNSCRDKKLGILSHSVRSGVRQLLSLGYELIGKAGFDRIKGNSDK